MQLPGITIPVSSVSVGLPLSGETTIDALVERSKWGDGQGTAATVTFSFPYTASSTASWATSYTVSNEPAYNPAGFNTTQQAAARSALQQWANVANIVFTEVADTATSAGDIRFAFTSVPEIYSYWGWTYPPNPFGVSGGDIWINPQNMYRSWAIGSYNYMGLLHELGHAIGLKHPFESGIILPTALDTMQYSLMSYTDHPYSLYFDGSTYTTIVPQTPMLYDIAAIQYLYGANMSYNSSDTTYTFDPATPFFMTIWDAGGTDTISVSNFSKGCIINLEAGAFSKITIESVASRWRTPTYDGTDNLAVAYNVTIENAIGGSGNDQLLGNAANNRLTGGAGNDILNGGLGIDTAVYTSTYTGAALVKTATGWTISGNEGADTLAAIERLQFSDKKVALDLSLDGNAAKTELIVNAGFGQTYVSDPRSIGLVLGLFDSGITTQEMCQLAVTNDLFISLAGSSSNADVVTFVYTNVVGVAPTSEVRDVFAGFLLGSGGSYSQAAFLEYAMTSELNQDTINLAGLQTTGVEYA